MPVQKGNKIYIPSGDISAKETTINWQQSLRQRSEQYYVVQFLNKDQGDDKSLLFIQKNMLDHFKSKSSGDQFTVVVDDSFQYGQKNKTGEGRWLAFHDKEHRAFQGRFMESIVSKYSTWLMNTFGGKFHVDLEVLKRLLGDPLHNF